MGKDWHQNERVNQSESYKQKNMAEKEKGTIKRGENITRKTERTIKWVD